MRFTTMMMGGMILGVVTTTAATVDEFKSSMMSRKSDMDGYHYCDQCAEICFMTEDCRRDPNSQGSYCKKNNHPATCLGLYYTRPPHLRDERGEGLEKHRRKFCYQPNDPDCPVCFNSLHLLISFLGTIPSSLRAT
jgi:hypothetical protein